MWKTNINKLPNCKMTEEGLMHYPWSTRYKYQFPLCNHPRKPFRQRSFSSKLRDFKGAQFTQRCYWDDHKEDWVDLPFFKFECVIINKDIKLQDYWDYISSIKRYGEHYRTQTLTEYILNDEIKNLYPDNR